MHDQAAVVPCPHDAPTLDEDLVAEMTWQAGSLSIAIQTTPSCDGYQQVTITATREGFSATRDSWLDDGDLDRFADQVHHIWQNLTGTAELYGEHGIEFALKLTMTGSGHIDIHIEINQPWASLRIEAQTDQTFLPALHDALLTIR
jgi:hypothetical protein